MAENFPRILEALQIPRSTDTKKTTPRNLRVILTKNQKDLTSNQRKTHIEKATKLTADFSIKIKEDRR